jgi:ATP-dependent Clp protease ATP-binding subunit ClpB
VFVGRADGRGHISILRGLKEKYRAAPRRADHRQARWFAAATLSNRYITDRFLPDKAIDLMDEAPRACAWRWRAKPEEIENLDRRIIQLKIEREALKKETDPRSRDRLAALEEELANLEQQSAS